MSKTTQAEGAGQLQLVLERLTVRIFSSPVPVLKDHLNLRPQAGWRNRRLPDERN